MINEKIIETIISLLEKVRGFVDAEYIDIEDNAIEFSTGCSGVSKKQYIEHFMIPNNGNSVNVKVFVEESTDFSKYTTHQEFFTFDDERIDYVREAVNALIEYSEIKNAIKELTGVEISEEEIKIIALTYKKTWKNIRREKEQLKKMLDEEKKKREKEEERVKDREKTIIKLEILAGLRELDDKQKILVGSNYANKPIMIMDGAVKVFENKYITIFEKDDNGKKYFMIKSKETIPNPFYIARDDNGDLLKMIKEYERVSIMEINGIMYRYKDID